jgi:hypothetical protein
MKKKEKSFVTLTTEEEILSNNKESDHFTEFLSILGEKVRLKGEQ